MREEQVQRGLVSSGYSLEEILDGISDGVLLLDERLRPILTNRAARELLALKEAHSMRLPSDELLSLARLALEGEASEELLKLWFPAARTLRVRAVPLSNGGVLMTLQDATEEVLARKVRREFVTHASHELKSPVAGIQTLASAIRQALDDDRQTAERFADRLVQEADRLGRLISDLLDLSRLEESESFPDDPVDLAEIAHKIVDELDAQAAAKGISLSLNVGPRVVVNGDAQQLCLLVRNLVDNAIRYTSDQGSVQLDVLADGSTAVVRVTDDGIGIPLEAQARVFERFFRVDKARSRDRGGTGLGLAIVKHVAELHRGAVEVRSALGSGSVFTATLPVGNSSPQDAGGSEESDDA